MINMDEIHFVAAKKKSQFKIKTQVGPFICNSREVGEDTNKLLKEMEFILSFTWSYNPLGIISKLREETKFTPYFHTTRPEIEKYKNQVEWVENTLQEEEEQHVSSSIVQTPTMQEKATKRSREEESSLGTDIFSEGFKIMYGKKAKPSSRLSLSKD